LSEAIYHSVLELLNDSALLNSKRRLSLGLALKEERKKKRMKKREEVREGRKGKDLLIIFFKKIEV